MPLEPDSARARYRHTESISLCTAPVPFGVYHCHFHDPIVVVDLPLFPDRLRNYLHIDKRTARG